ncbi:unnamed protein product [Cuscuta campestris]|uniref:ribonuclease Z n=1 Tax=Cuscuta campestris TaxID=132261 RepID=A0A484NQ10_9ASTE|nr:unnamed protein product [Cuscuta campestris]
MEEKKLKRKGDGLKKDPPHKRPSKDDLISRSTVSFVQILGNGMDTHDASSSVLLFFDHQRYIFNAGEGLQRFCAEYKVKLSQIDHILFSHVCSETAGGLPGLLLTMAGMGQQQQPYEIPQMREGRCTQSLPLSRQVKIWGPSDLNYLVDAMRCFVPNDAMVHTKAFRDNSVLIENADVKISAILLWPEDSSLTTNKDDSSKSLEENKRIGLELKPGDMSVVYVCELAEKKGTFHPDRAMAKGIQPGPQYSMLKNGKSVFSKLLNIEVHPTDVMDPPTPGPVVLLVDCPTKFHFHKLMFEDSLRNYFSDFSGERSSKLVSCVIHLSPISVINDPDYQTWMKRFGSAQHIIAGHQKKNVEIPILGGSARIASRLNYLCPQFFPAPGFWSVKKSFPQSDTVSNEGSSPNSSKMILAENLQLEGSTPNSSEIISAKNMLKFKLQPIHKIGLDRSFIPSQQTASQTEEELLTEIPEIAGAKEDVQNLCDPDKEIAAEKSFMQEGMWPTEYKIPDCLENVRDDDLEIVLLGTGSSQPSKYRNVSSIYINLFSKGGLLLDCGEGTLGQMRRRFGIMGADKAVSDLSCIWISHIHADHHAGLARILTRRRDLLKGLPHSPTIVVGPWQLENYLNAYQVLEDLDMLFLDCRNTIKETPTTLEGFPRKVEAVPIIESLKRVLGEAGLDELVSFPVRHCGKSNAAFGVVIKASERVNSVGKVIEGWKVVYSGDTRPCSELIEASRGATLLIHEATFEDGKVGDAIKKEHSTMGEAIKVGADAGVYRIILTHFSQRYPKLPVFDEIGAHMKHKICIGFDLMSVNLMHLHVLPQILPYLTLLFNNERDDGDDESEDIL